MRAGQGGGVRNSLQSRPGTNLLGLGPEKYMKWGEGKEKKKKRRRKKKKAI